MIRPVVGKPLPHAPVKSYKKSGMNIYPNPAVDILYIDLEPGIERGLVRYKLFNRHGQMVYHGTGNNNSIELSSFPPGIYFLQAEFGSTIFETKKILITH
jgi:hypothetical protein